MFTFGVGWMLRWLIGRDPDEQCEFLASTLFVSSSVHPNASTLGSAIRSRYDVLPYEIPRATRRGLG